MTDRLSNIILYTENPNEEQLKVPSVIGKTPSEANELLTNCGFVVKIVGTAVGDGLKITEQSIAADTVAPRGTVITVTAVSFGFED